MITILRTYTRSIKDAKRSSTLSETSREGDLRSRTATKLVREWIDMHVIELRSDWELAQAGRELKKIEPLE